MKKGTVLMVDDNLDMLLIGQRIFTKAGFEYLSARSGLEGLEKMAAGGVDIVILDYMLLDLNGLQFLETIAADPAYAPLRAIPVIVLTARTDYLEELDSHFAANLRAVLTKPFGHRELVNVVENALRLERNLRPLLAASGAGRPEPLHQEAAAGPGQSGAVWAAPGAVPEAHWSDDLRIAVGTIARLTAELRRALPEGLNEQQRLDLDAVVTSSRRLMRMIDAKFPESELFTTTLTA